MIAPRIAGGPDGPSLLVFSDDWGRHPSSCQHLVRRLLGAHPVTWVNTIGTRTPRLDLATLRRGWEKVQSWVGGRGARGTDPSTLDTQPSTPSVVSPRMWPWFTRSFDRRLNRSLLVRQLRPVVERIPGPVVAVTTLPITADLVGRLPVDRWVYYCVDDFSVWPGLDGRTLDRMEADLVRRVDDVITVSDVLADRVASFGRSSTPLTHGIDLEHWRTAVGDRRSAVGEQPVVMFWGVVDRRMDVDFVRALSESMTSGSIVLVGPRDDPDPALLSIDRVKLRPAVPYDELPALARTADVLVMPYADQPVTRAMQPLKLKEYLATGKPVVVRDLPAVREWRDALDAVNAPEEFAAAVGRRLAEGVPAEQRTARERLREETWDRKAERFAEVLFASRRIEPVEVS